MLQTIEYKLANFKVRCSMISVACSESKASAQLTELQKGKLKELSSKENITEKQKDELALLIEKEKNSKEIILSDGYIGYLMDEYAYITEGMIGIDNFEGLQMINGTLVEADSLIALREAENKSYMPNINDKGEQEPIFNDYLSGRPDAYLGKSLMEAEEIPDIKSSFDYPSFLKKIHTGLTKANRMQVQGYMCITGAPIGFIVDCLSNTHETVIDGLKWKLLRQLQGVVATEESEEFKKEWAIIEQSTKFDHIPAKLRVNKKAVLPFTEFEQQFLYDQVKKGRDFMSRFYETRKNI